jgi:hypothetical protein
MSPEAPCVDAMRTAMLAPKRLTTGNELMD